MILEFVLFELNASAHIEKSTKSTFLIGKYFRNILISYLRNTTLKVIYFNSYICFEYQSQFEGNSNFTNCPTKIHTHCLKHYKKQF